MSFYQVKEWKPGVYRIFSPECVHEDLIVGTEKALLLDTGWGLGDLKRTVRKITDKPLILVNSHGHVDHANGNTQFEEPVYIHPRDMELCKEHCSAEKRKEILRTVEKSGLLPEGFDREAYEKGGTGNLTPVEEGTVFDLGGKTLEVVELPGHTGGSIGLLYREEKVLYVGDAMNSALLLFFPEATSLKVYTQTLEKARNLDFVEMVQSHRPKIFGKEVLERYLKLAKSVDWETARPYIHEGKELPNVRYVCTEGMTLADIQNPDFDCIVVAKDKL